MTDTLIDGFERFYDFGLDRFQRQACEALHRGRGVLVAAPTGAGKTVVGEFAVHLALSKGGKCFYTTPIKALSNQKFNDLTTRYGQEKVGLLTGDNSINGDAPVVVMTTEVLRNMLYAGSATLADLSYVVMDEVHYLADRSRGAVWEEVIIHLPEQVAMASLSATVSNAEEFGEWLRAVRGETDVIVEERRPVPLYQHVMAGRRLYDLFAAAGERRAKKRTDAVNPALMRLFKEDRQGRSASRASRGRRQSYRRPGGRRLVPRYADVVWRLDREALLPGIVFIFSRAGCDAAVQQCLNRDTWLTTDAESAEIRRVARERTAALDTEDLETLAVGPWLEALRRGVASHHAGLVPVFKECVEELFARGLVKVVFATETLALGINMPARSVVVSKLTKWNGQNHADITPGEYTQLTGRAGRRGIDIEGHAVTLWAPGFDPKALAGLASTRTYPLLSSFHPSYNMAVNLVGQFGMERSRQLLESSFAQFQADQSVVGLAQRLRTSQESLDGYAQAMTCDRGDFLEYVRLQQQLADSEAAPSAEAGDVQQVRAALRTHPCHRCPQRDEHARWAERYLKLERQATKLRRRVDNRTNTLTRQFERVCHVLRTLGYLDGEVMTDDGAMLGGLYSELDLVAAECLRSDTWKGLPAPGLAAALSALVYESRSPDDARLPRVPGGPVRDALQATVHIWASLHELETEQRLDFLREPDLGFGWAAYRWAGGAGLGDVLSDVDLAAGDFVRWIKQVIDLAEQIAVVAPQQELRATAREAVHAMRRGVVAYSSDL